MNSEQIHDWRAAFQALVQCSAAICLALLAACGGSDGDIPSAQPAPATAPPVVPLGDPVTATVGPSGTIAFTASGIPGVFRLGETTVQGPTTITITPVSPETDEWARVQIQGLQVVTEDPAVLTFTLPVSSPPGKLAAGWQVLGDSASAIPATVDVNARSIAIPVYVFGSAGTATARVTSRRVAATADPSPTPLSRIAAKKALTVEQRLAAMKAALDAHERMQAVESGVTVNLSVAATKQMIGEASAADVAAIINAIATATTRACMRLGEVMAAAQLQTVPPDMTADTVVLHQFSYLAPIFYWQAIVMKLGGDPCPGLNVQSVLTAKEVEMLDWVRNKCRDRTDPACIGDAVKPVQAANRLTSHTRVLGAASLGNLIQGQFVQPAVAPVRTAAWNIGTSNSSQDHYLQVLPLYGVAAQDLQMVGTALYVTSYDGGAPPSAMGNGSAGAGASYAESRTETTVAARVGGSVEVTGPIFALKCPAAGTERLVIEFEGAKVLDIASVGDRLLSSSITLQVSDLLAAASIPSTTSGVHALTVKRIGSSCNPVFGIGDATLIVIRLDFAAGKPPPPSRITGKTFRGSVKQFYMPFDHPDCSRSCLERSPFTDRCPISESFEAEVRVEGLPSSYSATYRVRPTSIPDATWYERLFRGAGSAASFSGTNSEGSATTLSFGVDELGALSGTAIWRCHLEELTLVGGP